MNSPNPISSSCQQSVPYNRPTYSVLRIDTTRLQDVLPVECLQPRLVFVLDTQPLVFQFSEVIQPSKS